MAYVKTKKTISADPQKTGKPGRKPGKGTAVNQDDNAAVQADTMPVLADNAAVNPSVDSCAPSAKKKTGRPKGSTDKQQRKRRTDCNVNITPDENSNMIRYAQALSALPDIDYNNLAQVKQQIADYFNVSVAYGFKPAVASLAAAFHVDRVTLFNWLTGKTETIKNKECLNTLKEAYTSINMLYEVYMNSGKINPVAGIFLMKNNMGYKDTTDYVISATTEQPINLPDIASRAGLLTE